MKYWCIIACSAIGVIGAITGVALSMGHDSILVTAATSSIVGIAAGISGYYKGKTKASKNGNKN